MWLNLHKDVLLVETVNMWTYSWTNKDCDIRRNPIDFCLSRFATRGCLSRIWHELSMREIAKQSKRFANSTPLHKGHWPCIHMQSCMFHAKNPCTLVLRVVASPITKNNHNLDYWSSSACLLCTQKWLGCIQTSRNVQNILSMSIMCNKFQTKSSIACLQPIVYWVCWDYWASHLGCLPGKTSPSKRSQCSKVNNGLQNCCMESYGFFSVFVDVLSLRHNPLTTLLFSLNPRMSIFQLSHPHGSVSIKNAEPHDQWPLPCTQQQEVREHKRDVKQRTFKASR